MKIITKKQNIFLIGPISTGKSTIGRQLSKQLNIKFFDSNQEIEKRSGVNIEWIYDIEGEIGFKKREKKIINELTKLNGIIIAIGTKAIESHEIYNYLSSRGIIIYLETTINKQLSRIKLNKKHYLLHYKKLNLYENLKNINYNLNPLYEKISDIIIHTDKKKPKIITNKIIDILYKSF